MDVVKRIKNAIGKFFKKECEQAIERHKKSEKLTNLIFYRTYFLTSCINHIPISSARKTTKAYVCLATNPTALPKKLKIAPTKYPTIASNASTVFPARLLRASANSFNHFFKVLLPYGEDDSDAAGPPLLQ